MISTSSQREELRVKFPSPAQAFILPALVALSMLCVDVAAAEEARTPILKARSEGVFDLKQADNGSAADTWKKLAKRFDFQVKFADDFENHQVRLDLKVKSLSSAMSILGKAGGHAWKVLDENTVEVRPGKEPAVGEIRIVTTDDETRNAVREKLRARLKAKQADEKESTEEGGGGAF